MRAGRGDTAQAQEDAARYGVILEQHHLSPQSYRLWVEHWPAVNLFMRCLTQWRSGMSGVLGLDYGVMMQVAPVLGVAVDAQLLDQVQTMEAHAIVKLNRRN